MPASARDWFERQGATDVLADHGNDDPLVPVKDWERVDTEVGPLVPFGHENQGVCTWAFALGVDDPAVLVVLEDGWLVYAPTFSAYTHATIWDYARVFRSTFLAAAQNEPLSPTAERALKGLYGEEIPTRGWPAGTQHRFTGANANLLIWAGPDQADWWIGAPDAASLEEAVRAVGNLDEVGPSLYGCNDATDALLARIRAEGLPS